MTTWIPSRKPHATNHTLFMWMTFFFTLISWAGGLPVLHVCGEEIPPLEGTIGLGDPTQDSLLLKSRQAGRYRPAPTLKTDVRISVTGIIARTTLRQEFVNPSRVKDDWAEGIYVFPLPDTAAVDHLRMQVGGRTIVGEIKERAEAKKVYEQAKQDGKRASLVEQERPNVFTTSVSNIAPGDRIIVEIEYQETVRYDQGTFSLRFPMVVGPRYIPGTPVVIEDQPPGHGWSLDTDRVPDASRITPPVQHPDRGPINPVSLTIDLAAGFPIGRIESTYHEILTIAEPDGRQHITLRQDYVPANKDFQLTWEPAKGRVPTATIYTQKQRDDSYALLMVTPPSSDHPVAPVPRETIFVIDTSGSMAGTSIEQARAALLLALNRLTTRDRFNIIQFNSVTHVLFSQPQPVRTETLKRAVHYVEQLRANGGTDILPALKMALRDSGPSTHLRQVTFLTDGQVGNEDELFEVIREQLGTSRLFTIGIGSAPNSHFMRKAAEFGRGTFTHIGSTGEVTARMDAIFRKLERPVLTELHIEGFDETTEMFPVKIPDLYDGEPVVVALKTPAGPSNITIKGSLGAAPWMSTVDLKDRPERDGLSVYWARQKIASLLDQPRFGQDKSSTRRAVLDVALAHHLVSTYTSLVAVDVDPVRPTETSLVTHAMKTNLPEGQDYQAIFGLPKTATSGQLQLLLGLVALALAALGWGIRKRLAWARSAYSPPLGVRPTLVLLLRRMRPEHLRCSRSRTLLNVFRRIRLRLFEACGLASARISLAASRTATSGRFLALTLCLLAVGLWQIGGGSWIYAKARVAQLLLQRAWSRTLAGESNVKPWPWADTWPVARLTLPSKSIDLIVLNGAYGRTLAFGPGYVESSAFPGSRGTTILTGHRDTHFAFLENLAFGDRLTLQTERGGFHSYRVREHHIVNQRTASILIQRDQSSLVLVTCYPFDTAIPGGLLRVVIIAEAEEV